MNPNEFDHNSTQPQTKDREIFWEVTRQPQDSATFEGSPTDKNGFVDGNHPNLTQVLTHEEIETASSHNQQSKRVKKILPPYQHNVSTASTQGIAQNLTDTTIKEERNEEPLRPAVVEELSIIEFQGGFENIKEATASDTEFDNKTDASGLQEKRTNLDNLEDISHNETKNNVPHVVSPIQLFNIQGVSPSGFPENETSREILDVTPAAVKAFQGNSLSVKENDVTTTTAKSTASPATNTFEETDMEIEGIRLVPEERFPTTERTIWDLIQEQQRVPSETGNRDENNIVQPEAVNILPYQGQATTAKPLFGNFDAESQEMEYESENFQHGLSNIEKHELPFSYALPWIQIQDKEFESDKDSAKSKELSEKDLETRSRLAAVSSDEEELRIPADMSRLLRLSELPELGADVAVSVVQSGAADTEPRGCTKWYLLLLTGNSTIVQKRRDDFTKYLRLNLAARLSVEYDDVKVNKLILAPPRVLVNVSVYAPSDDIAEESQIDLKEKFEEKGEGPLHKLAESNATLLELSGEEYRVVRFLSLQAQPPAAEAQRDSPKLTSISSRHEDIEFVIYTFLGSACACAILLTLFVALNKYLKKWMIVQWPWKQLKAQKIESMPEREEQKCTVPPAVIYSGGFPQIRGSWMGPPVPSEPPSVSSSSTSLLQRYPGIELGTTQPESPRHNKLRMYNCKADRVLVRKLPESSPLDVRIQKQNTSQENSSFAN